MNKVTNLNQIGKVSPSKDFCEQAKKRIMQRIRQNQSSWLENLLYEFHLLKPAQTFQKNAKQRLFYKINAPFNWIDLVKQFLPGKRTISLATVFGLIFAFVFNFTFYTPKTVEAVYQVHLEIVRGEPLVKKLGEDWKPAKPMMEMHIGDKIFTNQNDVAEIYFFDNSVTRLAGNSQLTITGFFKAPTSEKIELELNNGRAWNKVIQTLTENSNFSFKTHNSLVSAKNATFDVAVEDNYPTEITVVNHLIDVKILKSNQNQNVVARTKVTEGHKVEVQVSAENTIAQTAQISPIEEKQTQEEWFQENIEKDEEHIQNIQKKNSQKIIAQAGILPDSPFYPVKKTFAEAKKVIQKTNSQEDQVSILQQKLKEASAFANKGDLTKSQTILEDFQTIFKIAIEDENIKTQLQENILSLQNNFVTVLPDSNLYIIKEFLRDLDLQINNNPTELITQKRNEKLFEAQDLISNGEMKLAQEILEDIQAEQAPMLSSGSLIASIDETEKKSVLIQKSDELQILQSIKSTVDSQEENTTNEVLPVLKEITQQTVLEINSLMPPEPEAKPILKPIKPVIIPIAKKTIADEGVEFVNSISVYKSERGKNNAILLRLNRIPNETNQIPLLVQIRKNLPLEYQHIVTKKILEIAKK